MRKEDEIVEAIRKKFEINPREWQHLCFEGEYVPEMIREAVRLTAKEIFDEIDNAKLITLIAIPLKSYERIKAKWFEEGVEK